MVAEPASSLTLSMVMGDDIVPNTESVIHLNSNPEEGMVGSLSDLLYEEFHMRVVYYSSCLKSSSSTVFILSTRWHHITTVSQA